MKGLSFVYYNSESYWIACEIAGTPYAFNDWALSHWGMMSEPVLDVGKSKRTLSACAGNEFLEPGALHYLPGEDPVIMSFNGCKQAGCAQYGMRKIKISPRFSHEKALKMYSDKLSKAYLNVSITSSTRAPVPKSAQNGRQAAGVQMFHNYWLKYIPCSEMNKETLDMLLARRQYSLQAGKIYCSESGENRFCNKKNKRPKKKVGD